MTIFLLVLGLLLFVGLVVIHELGHFIMARRNGVEVEEFGIGFPPRAKVITEKRGTEYTLNWLPLGGFVKLKGEHDADTEKGTFGAASLWAKVKIMLAGVAMNFVTAIVLFTLLALIGIPMLITKDGPAGQDQFSVASDKRVVTQQVVVGYVEPDSPAAQAGLVAGDKIVSVTSSAGDQLEIKSQTEFKAATKQNQGSTLSVAYLRGSEQKTTTATLRTTSEVEASLKTDNPKGYIGVAMQTYEVDRYTWAAPIVGVGTTWQLTKLTLKGLGTALSGLGRMLAGLATFNTAARQNGQVQATEQVGGPLRIVMILKDSANEGIRMVLFIIAVISLTLAVMNVLPIPALDGGRLFVMMVYRALRRPLTEKAEELINGVGFAMLMLLFVLITIVDVKHIF